MKLRHALAIIGAVCGLSACGGGGGDDNANALAQPVSVPDSATVSATAYQQFVAGVVSSDTMTVLDVNTVTKAPTSETQAPATI
jgi:hypothetical protein